MSRARRSSMRSPRCPPTQPTFLRRRRCRRGRCRPSTRALEPRPRTAPLRASRDQPTRRVRPSGRRRRHRDPARRARALPEARRPRPAPSHHRWRRRLGRSHPSREPVPTVLSPAWPPVSEPRRRSGTRPRRHQPWQRVPPRPRADSNYSAQPTTVPHPAGDTWGRSPIPPTTLRAEFAEIRLAFAPMSRDRRPRNVASARRVGHRHRPRR